MDEISVEELQARRASGADFCLLDVREPAELEMAAIEGALHMPMQEVAGRCAELPRDREIVVMCHHGQRSARVAQFLQGQGFERAVNLAGGIDAWSLRIDRTMLRY